MTTQMATLLETGLIMDKSNLLKNPWDDGVVC